MYVNTSIARHGNYGSKVLPKSNANTRWKLGSAVEVIWQILANVGACCLPLCMHPPSYLRFPSLLGLFQRLTLYLRGALLLLLQHGGGCGFRSFVCLPALHAAHTALILL